MIASGLISLKRESSVSLKTTMIASGLISLKHESSVSLKTTMIASGPGRSDRRGLYRLRRESAAQKKSEA